MAVLLAIADSIWLIFAAVPFTFGALACIAPRAWLSNAGYRRGINFLAYASIVPAAIAMASAIGFITVAAVALPALATFVLLTRMSRPRGTGIASK